MMFSSPAAAAVAAIAALCFFAGWNAQGWRKQAQIGQIEARHAAQHAQQQSALRAMESQFNEQMQTALLEANAREQALRADAAAAGTAAARLRTQLQQLRGELASTGPPLREPIPQQSYSQRAHSDIQHWLHKLTDTPPMP